MSLLGLTALALIAPDDWPQWLGPRRDGVWRETGILERFPSDGLKVRWRAPVGGGYSGPAVAGGRIYDTDRVPDPGAADPASPFERGDAASVERVLCFNAADGALLWKYETRCRYTVSYPAGPRTTPAVRDGRVFALGAEGHLACLSAADGALLWSRELTKDFALPSAPMWGFASHPLVDEGRLFCLVGGKGSAVVAFDAGSGRELWRALDAEGEHGAGYSAPVIVEAGGRRQLVAWIPRGVAALEPASGAVLWEQPLAVRHGLSVATPKVDGDALFVSAFYDGSMMLKLDREKPGASVLWKRKGRSERATDALHCLIGTPVLAGGRVYGVCSYGALRGLDAATGDRLWETGAATGSAGGDGDRWATAFIVAHADRYVLFNERGELILARLTAAGYEELSRARLLEPTGRAQQRRVVWSHPAVAGRSVFARNDKEPVCASLAAEP